MPIRGRLTAWYASLLAATVAIVGAFVIVQLRTDLESAIDRDLTSRAAVMAADWAEEFAEGEAGPDMAEDLRDICLSGGGATTAEIVPADAPALTVCAAPGDAGPAVPPEVVSAALSVSPAVHLTVPSRTGSERWRVLVSPIPGLERPRHAIVVAESLRDVDDAVERVIVLLLLAVPIAVAATAAAGWWLARQALQPVDRMTSRAERIGIERLHERIPVPETSDEIGHLGRTLNAMLDRLERGVEEKRRLVAEASHQLRTPLAVMRAELDVTLGDDELPAAAREVLLSSRDEVDRLSRTVDNLLTLAQADEGRLELLSARVDLLDVADAVMRRLEPLAAAKDVRLTVAGGPAVAYADQHRLQQAISNLADNAIRFAEPGGRVDLATWTTDGEVGLTVSDDGPGIPEADRPFVFDRFYRVAQAGNSDGSGLGLAICREIASAHRGRVWVDSAPAGGAAFSLALPRRGRFAAEPAPAEAPSPSGSTA